MSCDPARVSIDEYIDSNVTVIENVATLINTGGYTITNVAARVNIRTYYYLRGRYIPACEQDGHSCPCSYIAYVLVEYIIAILKVFCITWTGRRLMYCD